MNHSKRGQKKGNQDYPTQKECHTKTSICNKKFIGFLNIIKELQIFYRKKRNIIFVFILIEHWKNITEEKKKVNRNVLI